MTCKYLPWIELGGVLQAAGTKDPSLRVFNYIQHWFIYERGKHLKFSFCLFQFGTLTLISKIPFTKICCLFSWQILSLSVLAIYNLRNFESSVCRWQSLSSLFYIFFKEFAIDWQQMASSTRHKVIAHLGMLIHIAMITLKSSDKVKEWGVLQMKPLLVPWWWGHAR